MKDRIHSIGNKREKYPRVSAWRAFTVHRVGGQDAVKLEMCVSVDLQCTHGGVCVGCRQLMWQASVYRGLAFAAHRGIDAVRRYGVPCARFPDSFPDTWQLSVILSGAHQPRHTQTNRCLHLYLHPTTHILILFVLIYVDTKSLNETHTCSSRLNLTLNWD